MADLRLLWRRFDRWMIRSVPPPMPWWVLPTGMVALAAAVLAVSLVFNPGPGETVQLWGGPWGSVCAFRAQTGLPCPQCGMTRSWVYAARLHVVRSFLYNPAGAALFWWAMAMGVVGAVRLALRDPKRLRVPDRALAAWVLAWLVGLYAGGWVLRITCGLNPLP